MKPEKRMGLMARKFSIKITSEKVMLGRSNDAADPGIAVKSNREVRVVEIRTLGRGFLFNRGGAKRWDRIVRLYQPIACF